jgi:hypothetical protein
MATNGSSAYPLGGPPHATTADMTGNQAWTTLTLRDISVDSYLKTIRLSRKTQNKLPIYKPFEAFSLQYADDLMV